MSARALIFHKIIHCDKTFPLVPAFITQWPWPWSLVYLVLTFQLGVLDRPLIFQMNISCEGIKIFVRMPVAIFGISHCRGHLCFTNIFLLYKTPLFFLHCRRNYDNKRCHTLYRHSPYWRLPLRCHQISSFSAKTSSCLQLQLFSLPQKAK